MSCQARRQNDQMACGPCGVQWDLDDPSPPPCGLECVGAADPLVDEDADQATTRGRYDFHTPAYQPIDDDFDETDLPHTMMEYD